MVPSRTSSRNGFSLLEVLIVLTVMALLAALVGPSIGAGLGAVSRRTVERDVEMQLLEARLQAIETRQETVLRDPVLLRPAAPRDTPPAEIELRLTLPDGWSYRVADSVAFRPDGGCSPGMITLEKPGEPVLTVPVDPQTCRARRVR